MSAGTVISGGFPGRVAQEVQPNPKCHGCLHFDGQGGRTGICTIGSKPWMCGDGDAQDIGYAPIARGAGSYLPSMSNHSVQAREVETQFVSDLYGSGSTRPVQVQEVTLGGGHIPIIKSFYARHSEMQKTFCRLHQGHGQSYGTAAPSNFDAQVCSCSMPNARDVAKALVPTLSNRERALLEFSDVVEFVEDVVQAGFSRIEKAVFTVGKHGKFVTQRVGDGSSNIDVHFHPSGGGDPVHVGTANNHANARKIVSRRVDSLIGHGPTTPQQREAAAVEIAPGWHAQAGEERKKRAVAAAPAAPGFGVHATPGEKTKTVANKVRGEQSSGVPQHIGKSAARLTKAIGEIEKGARSSRQVATAPEVPTTEKPYQTRFKRPNDSGVPETPKKPSSESWGIDTSKLRARGEAGAAKLMAQNTPRGDDNRGARVGQAAAATKEYTGRSSPAFMTAPSVNRPGQNRPEFGGSGPAKPAAPKHIEMPAMDVSRTPSKPIAQVPSMSTMPKKTEREMPRVSYKALDSVARLSKAVDEIEKAGKTPEDVEKGPGY